MNYGSDGDSALPVFSPAWYDSAALKDGRPMYLESRELRQLLI